MIGFTIIPAVLILLATLVKKIFPLSGPKWKEQKMELQ
jgi:hypothetical protein